MKSFASKKFVTKNDMGAFLEQFGGLLGPLAHGTDVMSIEFEGPLLNGKVEVHAVQPGLQLVAMNLDVGQGVELNIEPGNPGMFISLVLEGESDYTVPRSLGRVDQWKFRPGRSVVGTFQAERSRWELAGNHPHRLVELNISSGRAAQLISKYAQAAQPGSNPVPLRADEFPGHIRPALTPQLRMIAHQILDCPLEGPTRRLFMESKALELLAFQLNSLSSSDRSETTIWNAKEHRLLEDARSILELEFADPPSLLTLARRVGLNDFKLKRGFRDLYNTTVFGYVRMLRMEKAKAML
jgi:hypothetical protein